MAVTRETPKIHEAFEYYYLLGQNRSLARVAEKFNVSKAYVEKWSSKFNWVERCKERDRRNMELVAEADDKAYVEGMRNYKKMISASIAKFIKALQDDKVAVNSVKDFEKLVRLDLELSDRIESNNDSKLNSSNSEQAMSILEVALNDIRKDINNAISDSADSTNSSFASIDDVLDEGGD